MSQTIVNSSTFESSCEHDVHQEGKEQKEGIKGTFTDNLQLRLQSIHSAINNLINKLITSINAKNKVNRGKLLVTTLVVVFLLVAWYAIYFWEAQVYMERNFSKISFTSKAILDKPDKQEQMKKGQNWTHSLYDIPLRQMNDLPEIRVGLYKRCIAMKNIDQAQLLINNLSGACSVRLSVKSHCKSPLFIIRLSGSALLQQTAGTHTPSPNTAQLWKNAGNSKNTLAFVYYEFDLPVFGDYFLDIQFLLCNGKRGGFAANNTECVVPPACGSVNHVFTFTWRRDTKTDTKIATYLTVKPCNDVKLRTKCPYWIKKADVYPARMLPTRYQSFDIPFNDPRQVYHWSSSDYFKDYEFGFIFPSFPKLIDELSKQLGAQKHMERQCKLCFFGDSFPLYISWPILRSLTGADASGNNVSNEKLEYGKKHWSYISQVWAHVLEVKQMYINNNIRKEPIKSMRDYRKSQYPLAFANCTHIFINFGQWNGAAVRKKYADQPDYFGRSVSRQIDMVRNHSKANARLFVFSLNSIPTKSGCPVSDWRTPVLLDEYNHTLEIVSREKNLTYINIGNIANPMYDEPPDGTHFGPGRATILAKYLLWRALNKDIY
eukprot:Nk52_evm25s684 gene=Nk52_evmTU25s684